MCGRRLDIEDVEERAKLSSKNLGRTSKNDELRGLLDSSFSRGKKRRLGWRIAGPIIIVCAVVAVLVAADYALNSGRVYWGVEVGTVSLGGKTPAEAREAVEERTTGALKEFEFSGPENSEIAAVRTAAYTAENFVFTAEEMGVDFDVAATVDEAYSVGRRGSILDRLQERTHRVYTAPFEIEPRGGLPVRRSPENKSQESGREARRTARQRATVEIYGSEAQVSESC